MVRVVKKDHTKEPFNIQKVVIAVNKSANRVLYNFTEDELKSICNHVEGYIRDHHMTEIQIWQMHNIVESALESVRPDSSAIFCMVTAIDTFSFSTSKYRGEQR